jgi:hypothetical protein
MLEDAKAADNFVIEPDSTDAADVEKLKVMGKIEELKQSLPFECHDEFVERLVKAVISDMRKSYSDYV